VVSTFDLILLGKLAPKNLAIAIPETVARSLAGSTLLFIRVGSPVIRLFDGAAKALLQQLGIPQSRRRTAAPAPLGSTPPRRAACSDEPWSSES